MVKIKVTLFGAPKDEKLLNKWRECIPRNDRVLSLKVSVCMKHFCEEDIDKKWFDGENNFTRKHYRLKKDAYPTIFPDCPKYLNIAVPKNGRTIIKHEIHSSSIDVIECIKCPATCNLKDLVDALDVTKYWSKLI